MHNGRSCLEGFLRLVDVETKWENNLGCADMYFHALSTDSILVERCHWLSCTVKLRKGLSFLSGVGLGLHESCLDVLEA